MKSKETTKNLHKDHRARVRRRFVREGLQNFESHNALELLLFYAISRKDTNELAHRLLEQFGSFAAVLDADYEALIRVPGVGENTAALIKLIPQMARYYLMDKQTRYPYFGDIHKLGTYLVNYFVGETREKLVAVLLNNNVEMIDLIVVSEGTVNASEVSFRKVAEAAIHRNASSIVLAHNHPDGSCQPSSSDRQLTSMFVKTFRNLSIPIAEHIVVGGNSYQGILSYEASGTFFQPFGMPGLANLKQE